VRRGGRGGGGGKTEGGDELLVGSRAQGAAAVGGVEAKLVVVAAESGLCEGGTPPSSEGKTDGEEGAEGGGEGGREGGGVVFAGEAIFEVHDEEAKGVRMPLQEVVEQVRCQVRGGTVLRGEGQEGGVEGEGGRPHADVKKSGTGRCARRMGRRRNGVECRRIRGDWCGGRCALHVA
jgi:hypothetical protein